MSTKGDDAVSPVVGVMLMLVVTIIIAAVVSGFAGGLVSGAKKSPALTMDVQIANSGYFASSYFTAKVISVSDGIATKDLKMITIWTNSTGFRGGANVTATTNVWGWTGGGAPSGGVYAAPWGYGPGVGASNSGKPNNKEQQFGNYTLLAGTLMTAWPAGQSGGYIGTQPDTNGYGVSTQFAYNGTTFSSGTTPGQYVDGMQAVLGPNWESLRSGNIVNVRVIYLPSGETIFRKDVVVS